MSCLAELKQSQLSCELLATRKSLAEANFELQKEKTKVSQSTTFTYSIEIESYTCI